VDYRNPRSGISCHSGSANANSEIIVETQAGAIILVWDGTVGYKGSLADLTSSSRQTPVENDPANQNAMEAYAPAGY
jgi:hypothetical protein